MTRDFPPPRALRTPKGVRDGFTHHNESNIPKEGTFGNPTIALTSNELFVACARMFPRDEVAHQGRHMDVGHASYEAVTDQGVHKKTKT